MNKSLFEIDLEQRMSELGISKKLLAQRSGLSIATVHRVLKDYENANLNSLTKIAQVLGVDIALSAPKPVHLFQYEQAIRKATEIVQLVQATSGLEGQAVDEVEIKQMIDQTIHELLAGPKRRLWAA